MLKFKTPTEGKVRSDGVFLGYSMGIGEMYCEVFRLNNKNYVLLDYYNPKTQKLTYIVDIFYGRIGKLLNAFSTEDGSFFGDPRHQKKDLTVKAIKHV